MDPARRAFYAYHASLMEPWDGPASVCFSDGTVVGAVLDRNGLRPSRIWVTDDGLVVMASEAGVLDLDPATRRQTDAAAAGPDVPGRHRPGPDRRRRGDQGRTGRRAALPAVAGRPSRSTSTTCHRVRTSTCRTTGWCLRQQAFGFTYEELNLLVAPMARTGVEALGSMGTDTPIAVLSSRPRMLFDYFQQLFAQVTNPPLDAIREEVVTSLPGTVGPERDLLNPTADSCRQILLPQPILRNHELAKLINLDPDDEVNGHQHGMRVGGHPLPLPGRQGRRGSAPRSRRHPAGRLDGDRRRCPDPDPVGPGVQRDHGARSRRCCRSRRCTITWCGNAPAPRSVWSWSPVTPARCTTWPC